MFARRRGVAHLTSVHRVDDVRIFLKECRTLAAAGLEVALVGPSETSDKSDGVRILGVPVARSRLRRMTITCWHVLMGALASRAAVCHIHDPELLPIGFLLKLLGRQVIYDVHEDCPSDILTKDWIPPIVKRLLATLVAAVEAVAGWLFDGIVPATPQIARRFPSGSTYVVQNFPLENELTPASDRTFSQRSLKVAYLGGMTTIRGIQELVQAIDLVETNAVRLVLIGEFDERALEHRCRDESGWRKVDYLGWRSRSEVAKLLGEVRAGLVTYYPAANHIAAQPNKLFEYMAAGIPVIASDFPAWRRIVEGADCGLLVDPQDPRAIAAAIQWVLDHPIEAEQMGRSGRAAMIKEYNWEHESVQLLALYEELLA